MARVNVPVTEITRAGIVPATEVNGDATNNHYIANDGATWLEVRNAGASSRTLTKVINVTIDGNAVTNPTVTLAASAVKKVGPFPIATYGSTFNFNVDHADIKITAYRLAAG
jgi:archaellum component FlaG (FlaF/FlaG flagellin family)